MVALQAQSITFPAAPQIQGLRLRSTHPKRYEGSKRFVAQAMHNLLKLSTYFLPILILCGNSCASASQPIPPPDASIDTLIPYAPIKRPANPIEERNELDYTLPGPFPTVGILIALGSFNGIATWTIADLDTRKLSEIRTQVIGQSDGKYKLLITNKQNTL